MTDNAPGSAPDENVPTGYDDDIDGLTWNRLLPEEASGGAGSGFTEIAPLEDGSGVLIRSSSQPSQVMRLSWGEVAVLHGVNPAPHTGIQN